MAEAERADSVMIPRLPKQIGQTYAYSDYSSSNADQDDSRSPNQAQASDSGRYNGFTDNYVSRVANPPAQTAASNQIHINAAIGTFDATSSEVPPYATNSAYEDLTGNGIPDPYDLLERYFPFRDPSIDIEGSNSGVLKIRNTPYDVTKNEIVAMLGRDAKITTYPSSASYYGIHIMFDRSTGKTGEVMVELQDHEEALNVSKSLERYSRRTGKPRMCGNRVTQIQIVGQEELMALLFPKAKCCGWIGQVAHVRQPSAHESEFEGFLNTEELRQIVMHAQKPGKGQFGKNAPQRPYEAMISILQKFPWHQSDLITLAERDNLFNTTRDMVGLLTRQIIQGKRGDAQFGVKLNQQLLNELVIVACSETLFNPAQQRHLIDITQGKTQVHFPMPRLAPWWPFEMLSFRRNVNEKLLEYYAMLMKQATTSTDVLLQEEIEQIRNIVPLMDTLPFGAFVVRYTANKYLVDLADIARLEEEVVIILIRRVMDAAVDNGIVIPNCHNTPEPNAGPFALAH